MHFLERNFSQRFPFDWRNPIGYFIAVILQFELASSILEYEACSVCLSFACVLFIFSFAKDVKNHSRVIDENIKTEKSRRKVIEQLSDFIQFTNLKELVGFEKNLLF